MQGPRLNSIWSATVANIHQVAPSCPALPRPAPLYSSLLYPVRQGHIQVHMLCVLQEIQDLQSVAVPEHIGSNRTAQAARAARYPVTLSTYSFQLLMAFLQGSKLWLLLGIVNQHIKVQVAPTLSCMIAATDCTC